jgi:hypothetical protein
VGGIGGRRRERKAGVPKVDLPLLLLGRVFTHIEYFPSMVVMVGRLPNKIKIPTRVAQEKKCIVPEKNKLNFP